MVNADLRLRIVEAAYRSRAGHIPSALSIVDIIEVLYGSVMRYRFDDPGWADRDYFILSKGHGALALYAVLEKHGLVNLDDFCKPGSHLLEHPEMGVSGVEAATGSLGHGLPLAVGIALGLRMRGMPNRVFCLVGDGECNEGSVWEAALLASHLRLSNLCCIVDDNKSSLVNLEPLAEKWLAFGWPAEWAGGHSRESLIRALSRPRRRASQGGDRPQCVIAETVKGKGVPMMEKDPGQWHHRIPNGDEYRHIIAALQDTPSGEGI